MVILSQDKERTTQKSVEKVDNMREATRKNLKAVVRKQIELAKTGKNFDARSIVDCSRLLATELTEYEIKRINDCRNAMGILENENMMPVKDIKEKYNLSWNELKMYA